MTCQHQKMYCDLTHAFHRHAIKLSVMYSERRAHSKRKHLKKIGSDIKAAPHVSTEAIVQTTAMTSSVGPSSRADSNFSVGQS